MKKEGSGTCNGVSFAYSFSTESWFGSYECRVHRYFLDAPGKEFSTQEFHVGNHSWQLLLSHKKDGKLTGSLRRTKTQGSAPLNVHYSISVVNCQNKGNKAQGALSQIVPGTSIPVPQLALIADIKNKESGFLYGDSFTVRLDLRLKGPDNEMSSKSVDKKSGTFTWRLRSLNGRSPWRILSDEFTVANCKWQIVFYPRGIKDDNGYASFYICSCNKSAVNAKISLSAVNHQSAEKSITLNLPKKIFKQRGDWTGGSSFLRTGALRDNEAGFLKKDWITLSVAITIEQQQGTSKQAKQPPKPAVNADEGTECVICLDKPQIAGVLHGNTTHKCYCVDCAKIAKKQEKNLHCPICRAKVERVIEKMF